MNGLAMIVLMKRSLFALLLASLLTMSVASQQQQTTTPQRAPSVPLADRIRLAEAFRLGETIGDRVWNDWSRAPFAVLLVLPEYEFLIRHPRPPADFTLRGYDVLLKSDIYYRKRTQRTDLLATFPVGGVSTIVIGQVESTSMKTSTAWVTTVLHEHFHQLQYSQPTYQAAVAKLNLTRGDQTGMWMLNYDFPYRAPAVKAQFALMCRLLGEALEAKKRTDFDRKRIAYLRARAEFQKLLNADDFNYFSFQVWQEGVARYTQLRVARLAATKSYRPGAAFRALPDYVTYRRVAGETVENIRRELSTLQLDEAQRICFYPLGAGEALLLDRARPGWRRRYFAEMFYVENYFKL